MKLKTGKRIMKVIVTLFILCTFMAFIPIVTSQTPASPHPWSQIVIQGEVFDARTKSLIEGAQVTCNVYGYVHPKPVFPIGEPYRFCSTTTDGGYYQQGCFHIEFKNMSLIRGVAVINVTKEGYRPFMMIVCNSGYHWLGIPLEPEPTPPPTPKLPCLKALFSIAGLLAAVYLIMRKKK